MSFSDLGRSFYRAAIISGVDHRVLRDLLMIDVVPLSIGLETASGGFEVGAIHFYDHQRELLLVFTLRVALAGTSGEEHQDSSDGDQIF